MTRLRRIVGSLDLQRFGSARVWKSRTPALSWHDDQTRIVPEVSMVRVFSNITA